MSATHEDTVAGNLAALGAPQAVFRDGMRVISNGFFPPPLLTVLREILATVMTRKLTFRCGESHLSFLVSERRLMKVLSASDDISEALPLVDAELSHDQDEVLETVAAALARLVQSEASVLVETGFAGLADSSGGGLGLPVAMLADVMQISLDEREKPMLFFIEACAGLYVACLLRTDGAWLGTADETDIMDELQEIADTQWERFRESAAKNTGPLGPARMISLGQVLDGDLSVTAVWAGEECALFAHEHGDLAGLHTLWQRAFTL